MTKQAVLKAHCRNIAPKPYHYAGFWDGLYHFTKGNNMKGFLTVACNESDLKDGSLQVMARDEISRTI